MPPWGLSPVATVFAPIRADTKRSRSRWSTYVAIRPGISSTHSLRRTSPLRLERFFDGLYRQYDERNVVSAPDLATRNRRIEWSPDSPALTDRLPENLDYDVRISD
jgi:hypothetical protein